MNAPFDACVLSNHCCIIRIHFNLALHAVRARLPPSLHAGDLVRTGTSFAPWPPAGAVKKGQSECDSVTRLLSLWLTSALSDLFVSFRRLQAAQDQAAGYQSHDELLAQGVPRQATDSAWTAGSVVCIHVVRLRLLTRLWRAVLI